MILDRLSLSCGGFFLIFIFVCSSVKSSTVINSVKLVFGGDIEFSRLIEYLHDVKYCAYKNTLSRLKPHLKDADYIIANLETTLEGKRHNIKAKPHEFVTIKSDECALESLKSIGVTAVTLANNHIEDYRSGGVNETIKSLERHGIQHFGISYGEKPFHNQKPMILSKNGVKIGILGYCHSVECFSEARVNYQVGPALLNVSYTTNEVNKLRKNGCDIVILFMHWGDEYTSVLSLTTLFNIRDLLKGAKIDLIVGSHPHITHKHWYINNTLIATSLGNLLSTPYLQANLEFNVKIRDRSHDSYFENIAYKQSTIMKDETSYGRLLQVEFNKNGIVKKGSKYLGTEIIATKRHCIVSRKQRKSTWRVICRNNDPECIGNDTCNYLRCDGKDPFNVTP